MKIKKHPSYCDIFIKPSKSKKLKWGKGEILKIVGYGLVVVNPKIVKTNCEQGDGR